MRACWSALWSWACPCCRAWRASSSRPATSRRSPRACTAARRVRAPPHHQHAALAPEAAGNKSPGDFKAFIQGMPAMRHAFASGSRHCMLAPGTFVQLLSPGNYHYSMIRASWYSRVRRHVQTLADGVRGPAGAGPGEGACADDHGPGQRGLLQRNGQDVAPAGGPGARWLVALGLFMSQSLLRVFLSCT